MNEAKDFDAVVKRPRLTKLQRAILQHVKESGEVHVYIGPNMKTPIDSPLLAYTWAGGKRSLQSVVHRGLLISDRDAFYTAA